MGLAWEGGRITNGRNVVFGGKDALRHPSRPHAETFFRPGFVLILTFSFCGIASFLSPSLSLPMPFVLLLQCVVVVGRRRGSYSQRVAHLRFCVAP